MFSKSIVILLAALLALTVAETNSKHEERQTFIPEQFTQFTNKFQESFVNPSGGSGGIPQFPVGQIPTGFPAPGMPFSRRQLGDIASTIKDGVPFPMGSRHGYNY